MLTLIAVTVLLILIVLLTDEIIVYVKERKGK